MIRLENIHLQFDGRTILNRINLHVEAGESVVLVGPSGHGKSSLLKMIAGILKPNSGELFIANQNFHQRSPLQQAKLMRHIGMLFQKNALFDSMTVGENVAFPMRETTNLTEEAIQKRVEMFLEGVGILHAKNLFPDEISGGMQKRLGIARALALAPEIILYDDPTAGLDPITSRMIIQLIMKLQKENHSTVVAVTNDMSRAYQMADRICMVVDQELIVTGNKEQTIAHQDPRVHQFIRGELKGPLTEGPAAPQKEVSANQ